MLNLYADDQMYLMFGAFDALHSAANDLGDYEEKIFKDYNKVVAIAEKCSRSRQYIPPPAPPPPIKCNSVQLGNSISTTCQE